MRTLTLQEAAEHFGMSEDELVWSRMRGLEPGKSGEPAYAGGPLIWEVDEDVSQDVEESSQDEEGEEE